MNEDHRLWLRAFWDGRVEKEVERETVDPKKRVHTDLLRREIDRCVAGRNGLSILDAGAGAGRFSIPLAEAGHTVVHLDISPSMLRAAGEESQSRGISTIDFVQGSIDDLSVFEDSSFDLVLCLDAPLSFCYDSFGVALSELVRVARSAVVLCVMNRTGAILEGVNFDLKYLGELKTAPEVYDSGTLVVTEELRQIRPTLFPSWHAFDPDEIEELLAASGCRVDRISAPGTLARSVEPDLLKRLFDDEPTYSDYLDFEERYDSNTYVLGVGSVGAGGLLVTAQKTGRPERTRR